MEGLDLRFRVTNAPVPLDSLTAILYRSPGAHPDRYESTEKLQRLKSTTVSRAGNARLRLTEREITRLRQGRRKLIYLVLSIEAKEKPIHISGAQRLTQLRKAPKFVIDLTTGRVAPDEGQQPAPPPSPGPGPGVPDVPDENGNDEPTLVDTANASLDHRKEVNEALQETQRETILRRRNNRRKRRKLVRELIIRSLKRKHSRRADRYVTPGDSLEDAQKSGVQAGLEQLGKLMLPGMQSHLPRELLDKLGLEPGVDWQDIDPQIWKKLSDRFIGLNPGKRRERVIQDCRQRALAARVQSQLSGSPPDGSPQAIDDASAAQSMPASAKSLEDIYETLCTGLLSRLQTGQRPGTDEIADSVGRSITAGPADTTATYDFSTLTIAWEDIWTSVYDESTAKEVGKVFDDIVQVVGENVGDEIAKDIENTEYLELMDFVDGLNETLADARGLPGRAAPAALRGWLSGIDNAWHYLSEEDQSYLDFLHAVNSRPSLANDRYSQFPQWMRDRIPNTDELVSDDDDTDSPGFQIGLQRIARALVALKNWAKETAENLIAAVDPDDAAEQGNLGIGRLGRLMHGIHQRLNNEPYAFDIFAPGSYNYGLINTYQQKWTPLDYQAGDLISTIPLAPGEKKSYSVNRKVVSKDSRSAKQSSAQSSSSSRESIARSQADIVAKATYSAATSSTFGTNFGMKVGLFNGNANASGTISGNAARESQSTKQNIRESTIRAAQEFKDEHTLEVMAAQESETTSESSSEISNPNNEITVTYLFYELQRRFEVSSRLDKLTPVVMIAFDVPEPSAIDEDWLLTHDWILRRVLLDPSLVVALDYIRGMLSGDELSVEVYKAQWEIQVAAVKELKDNLVVHNRYRNLARQALQASTQLVADKFGVDDAVGVLRGLSLQAIGSAFGPLGALASTQMGGKRIQDALSSDLTKEEVAAAQESARVGMEWADADLQDSEQRYQSAVHALEKATQDYVDSVKRRQEMRTQIDQLRIHVKENILYYMQAIWIHEPADQRYFRLYDHQVIWPRAAGLPQVRQIEIPPDPAAVARAEAVQAYFDRLPFVSVEVRMPEPEISEQYRTRPLHQVADLDNLVGFKGNYAIFPLRKGNAVTNYMAAQFLDDYFGIKDPDQNGNYPTESEALEIARCMWERAGESDQKRRQVITWLTRVLENQVYVSDEIVVPSGELFIEALPGSHPLLEDFKLQHRAVDMEAAQQQLTHSRIETIRHVKRLLHDQLDDPDVDKLVQVSGATDVNVDTE